MLFSWNMVHICILQVNGVVLVYQAPAEAANPRQRWRLYQFKGGKPFQVSFPVPCPCANQT